MVDFIRLRGRKYATCDCRSIWPGRNDKIKSNLAKRIAHTVAEELKVDMGDKLVGKHEHCYVEKEFKGNQRADKK